MADHAIEFDEQCKVCKGTGLYAGMGERNGFAVVCYECNGTGCHHVRIEYDDFKKRIPRNDVRRILQANPGIVCGTDNGHPIHAFGGMSYGEWVAGKQFEPGMEMREFTCPAWWYQRADYDKKPDWDECMAASVFSGCKYFADKAACWDRWDRENGVK